MITALRRGQTGEQILDILDAITNNSPQVENNTATLEEIEF